MEVGRWAEQVVVERLTLMNVSVERLFLLLSSMTKPSFSSAFGIHDTSTVDQSQRLSKYKMR